MRDRSGPFLKLVLALVACLSSHGLHADTLEDKLKSSQLEELVRQARVLGDPQRGSQLFHRPSLSCVQCHALQAATDSGAELAHDNLLGPSLKHLGERANYLHVMRSILFPSEKISDGYQAEKILLDDGKIINGIIRSEDGAQVIVSIVGETQLKTISKESIEARVQAKSIMPAGLINQLDSQSEFFDLVSFLVEIGKHPENTTRYTPQQVANQVELPAYEQDLDHAGIIRSWNKRTLEDGEAIYKSLCVNCHGTRKEAGSLPNALRFASGKFKNGSDPYAMYRTLTHGYQMMLAQTQLVPSQKYSVIQYIREAYLKPHNASYYTNVDATYLDSLPKGKLRGPRAQQRRPWSEMDYGPFLISTYEITGPDTQPRLGVTREERQRAAKEGRPPNETWPDNTNFAYKGIAIRLDDGPGGVAAGTHWLAFDHDTMRVAGAWSGRGFMDWRGILFNGNHAVTPRTVGELHFSTPSEPGWANPETQSFQDKRIVGKDGRRYGPLPKSWTRYQGLYKHDQRVIVAYTVGQAPVLEAHAIASHSEGQTVWKRFLNVGKSPSDLKLRVAQSGQARVAVGGGLTLSEEAGYQVVHIPSERTPLDFTIAISAAKIPDSSLATYTKSPPKLDEFTRGGSSQWPAQITRQKPGDNSGPFAVDELTRPVKNPWKSRLRMSGLDFYEDGRSMVACCCDGDVWKITGIDQANGELHWKRIASGLFHPLGVKIVNRRIFVTCRDQIVVLHDLNGDEETDFYEAFNSDHQVTDHFHEFAMGLQADSVGNLYYAKSARHARDSLVPQHGTLIKVSADGANTEILANGFRAANGVCLNPDGSFFVTDQEGHWNPMNRINRVVAGGFYGNMYSYGAPESSSDDAMDPPLCWPNKGFDRSPSELLWVDSKQWGALDGQLLNLSYGYGKVYVVPHEQLGDTWQGGMCRLPLPQFPTGVMRARFAADGHMYACGMHAWGSDQSAQAGGLYRLRATGLPVDLPIGLHAFKNGIEIRFSDAVDAKWASQKENYLIDVWDLKRSANYGSPRFNQKSLEIEKIEVSKDGKLVRLHLPDVAPTWCMEISTKQRGLDGRVFTRTIQNTIYQLGDE